MASLTLMMEFMELRFGDGQESWRIMVHGVARAHDEQTEGTDVLISLFLDLLGYRKHLFVSYSF